METVLGPIIPFLRAELGLGYAATGLHFGAFALGSVLLCFFGERVPGRWGRCASLWSEIAAAHGVLTPPLVRRGPRPAMRDGLLLGFAAVSDETIREGVRGLASALRDPNTGPRGRFDAARRGL
jgi:MFS family permease